MLELKNINKDYQIRKDKYQKVLKNLNVQFPSKGFVSILGTSGGGKTTLLNIIGGLDGPDSGKIHFDETEILNHDDFRRDKVGFVFQDFNLVDHLNAVDNVILSMTDDVEHKKKRAREILAALELEDSFHKHPKQMSGGQRQRVAIARMIAKDVDIIVCDEPTGSLDELTSEKIINIIKDLSKDKLVIFVTHNRTLAETYSDQILELKNGKLNQETVLEDTHSTGPIKEKSYNKNCAWLARKNIIGRYPNTIRNILLISFIMLLSALTIILEGEFFKKYIHDISLDEGIKTIILDIDDPKEYDNLPTFDMEGVEHPAYSYGSYIDIAPSNYESNRITSLTELEDITSNDYIEAILSDGRMPESPDEVLMTAHGAITLLKELKIGGERLYDQYMTGEVSSSYVYGLMDDKVFIIAEYGYPRMKVVGLIDDKKIHESHHTLYIMNGFTDLFEYPKGLYPSRIILYKNDLYRQANNQIIEAVEDIDGITLNQIHIKKINTIYNKIDSFLQLSKIALYLIIAIAAISFISLLYTSLFERKYEIGLYRSKGYNKRNITHIIGFEMLFICIISLMIVMASLVIFAFVAEENIDYLSSLNQVFEMMNISSILLVLSFITLVFVSIIIFIGNRRLLKQTVLSNMKGI